MVAGFKDIPAIRDLISKNLKQNLGEDCSDTGFLSWLPDEDYLKKVIEKSFICVTFDREKLVGFVITLTKELAEANPLFKEMLRAIENLSFEGKLISKYKYLIFAQSCIDAEYRLGSVGMRLYKKALNLAKEYNNEIVIGQVVSDNNRSMSAHGNVSENVGKYNSETSGLEWNVFVRDIR